MKNGRDKQDNNHYIEQTRRKNGYKSYAISADYTITDVDKIKIILVTTGSSNITVTLPTASDNLDRVIEVIKDDSGTGYVILDGEGAETINGDATIRLVQQYNRITVKCDGSNWKVIDSQIIYFTGWTAWPGAATSTAITHNINTSFINLNYRIYWSSAGTTGTDNKDVTNISSISGASQYGQVCEAGASDNVINLIVPITNGLYLTTAGATQISTGKYNIKIKRQF
jgi:hypothetical protein